MSQRCPNERGLERQCKPASFDSVAELAAAMQRCAAAEGLHRCLGLERRSVVVCRVSTDLLSSGQHAG